MAPSITQPRNLDIFLNSNTSVDFRAHTSDIGVRFTTCEMADAAQTGPAPGGMRRQVVIGGRRITTVDVHAHCVVGESMAMMNSRPRVKSRPVAPHERIREMDLQGIDIEAVSINPDWYHLDRDLVARALKVQNEKLAELQGAHPDRFRPLASVALQYPDLAVQQIDYAVRQLGLRGVAVGSNVCGKAFSLPEFHPFWARCEALGILVFIHPLPVPELKARFAGSGWLDNIIGNPLDTTIALTHLIFEGTLDRFPGLKICAAHGGGYLASYAPRSDVVASVRPELCPVALAKKPTDYLRQIYYDSLVFTPEALRHLVAQVGSGQICIGTDHPVGWQNNPIDHILSTPHLTDDERVAILGATAARLLGIDA